VFLHECRKAGLDSAIVHAGKILPLNKIPDEQREVCLDLIYDRRGDGLRPAAEAARGVRRRQSPPSAVERGPLRLAGRGAPEAPHHRRRPRRARPPTSTRRWPGPAEPLAIINDHLLDGMKVVGELFGSGEMQLPFVLQSAETMKAAVAHLEPHMEKVEGESSKGRIVLATVKGDVHDIGKNLVDIILTNNGYEVHNLGIKVPIADMIAKAKSRSRPTPSA
jgi:5-methyltetrahydrofolate--homocysteine methyltransferase